MPADFRPEPEVSPDFLLHALLLAHFNAQQSGLRRRGLPHLGSPKILFLLMRFCHAEAALGWKPKPIKL